MMKFKHLSYLFFIKLVKFFSIPRVPVHLKFEEAPKPVDFDLALKSGEIKIVLFKKRFYFLTLFNMFTHNTEALEKNPFIGKLTLDDEDITTEMDALFFPKMKNVLNEFSIYDFIVKMSEFVKIAPEPIIQKFSEKSPIHLSTKLIDLSYHQRIQFSIDLIPLYDRPMYCFYDTVLQASLEMTHKFFNMMEELKARGKAVLYVTTDPTFESAQAKEQKPAIDLGGIFIDKKLGFLDRVYEIGITESPEQPAVLDCTAAYKFLKQLVAHKLALSES